MQATDVKEGQKVVCASGRILVPAGSTGRIAALYERGFVVRWTSKPDHDTGKHKPCGHLHHFNICEINMLKTP